MLFLEHWEARRAKARHRGGGLSKRKPRAGEVALAGLSPAPLTIRSLLMATVSIPLSCLSCPSSLPGEVPTLDAHRTRLPHTSWCHAARRDTQIIVDSR